MTKRIFRSFLVVALFVFLASVVFIMGVLYSYFSSQQKIQLNEQLDIVTVGVEADGVEFLKQLDPDGNRLTLIKQDGTVSYDSQVGADKMENHLSREEVKEAIKNGHGESSRYSTTMMEKLLYESTRLENGDILRISAHQQSIFGLLLGILQQLIVVLGLSLILALFLAYKLTKRLIQPLNDMDISGSSDAEYDEIQPLIDRIKIQKNEIEIQKDKINKAEMVRREFTANVAHELKTPLQTISGSAELMYDGLVKDEDIREFAGKIYSESKRLITLVDDITGLSQMDEGQYDHTVEDLDLYTESEHVIDELKMAAERADIELSLSGKHINISGIKKLIDSIIYNLTDNAIKYSKAGGHVSVDVSSEEDKAVLTVTDDGIGIPKEEQERIFERFYRVDKSRSKDVGGTGLGLSIVKHAAMVHGADIKITSEPGEGTSISIIFEAV